MIRYIGAFCIVAACGACGFSMAAGVKNIQKNLKSLQDALELIQCQMEFRLTELPELCDLVQAACPGAVGRFFASLGSVLQQGEICRVPEAVAVCLARNDDLADEARPILLRLGRSLEQMDLEAQLQGLEAARTECSLALTKLEQEKMGMLCSYRALGLCGGAALAILLL